MEKVMKPKAISESDKNYLMSLNESDITLDLLEELFAFTKDKPARFLPNDYFVMRKGKMYNDQPIKTTVGRYIFNLFVLMPNLIQKVGGYLNMTFNNKGIGKLESKLSSLLMRNEITFDEMETYLNKVQWLGFSLSKFLNTSLNYDLLVPNENIKKKKKELIDKYKKEINDGDIIGVSKMEKELLAYAKEEVKDLPAMQIYDSGGRGSFGNNYKNTTLFRGVIKNLGDSNKLKVSTSSLEDGIPAEELPYYADLITQASYQRAVGTQDGGFESKKLIFAFNSVVLDEDDSDCGTKLTVPVIITEKNKDLFLYRYILEKNKLVELTSENIDSYINKLVYMRSPMMCKGDRICNKCAGNLYKMIGIKNIGLMTGRIGSSLLNQSLKAFHNMTIKTVNINIDDYID